MRKGLIHIVLGFFFCFSFLGFSQEQTIKGYRIDGDDVVFTFDKRDYEKITSDKHQFTDDFEDFKIHDVIVSGQFNNWTRDDWKMERINENIFELRKKITDFTDEFSWEFKFLINGKFWAEPNNEIANIVPAKTEEGIELPVFNLKLYTAYQDQNGNACFRLKGFKDAEKVIIAGSFNKWDEDYFKMNKTENGWELSLQINPGIYEYRYIVDGEWIEDPGNPNKVENEYGEFNSVIDITKLVTINLKGFTEARKVILSGSFNDWSENSYKMKKTDSGWTYNLWLSGGKHHYKFIIDNEWFVDPYNPIKEYDGRGNINSVIMVK
ncbi:hypothetical protein C1T31_10785 [Hanstruepera neustonica]|uniref:AMP-activated protein kinase glycogen-binding domain-containing protein n=1 Tax=Hanstruepera neustonica TaxID=1445657 RepID=A0A2K1DX76_9FLAO|nr:hypothetical protein [Hanstruepera neustonica]PNQ72626.1 hypothetical protein C1T31_10785 [Hanstruepera neustonica]